MKKRAFTLIEMVISIAIFALIIVYMYQALATVETSNAIYERHYDEKAQTQKLKRLIYNDIFNQADPYMDVNLTTYEDNTAFRIRTHNTLHQLTTPYVTYLLKESSLFRLESLEPQSLPITYDNIDYFYVDKLMDNIEEFHVTTRHNAWLFYWKPQNEQNPIMLEIDLPYTNYTPPADTNTTDNNDTNQTGENNTTLLDTQS